MVSVRLEVIVNRNRCFKWIPHPNIVCLRIGEKDAVELDKYWQHEILQKSNDNKTLMRMMRPFYDDIK